MLELIKLVVNGIGSIFDALINCKLFYPIICLMVVGFIWISAATFLVAFGIFLVLFIINHYFGLVCKFEYLLEFFVGNEFIRYCLLALTGFFWWKGFPPIVVVPLAVIVVVVFLIAMVADGVADCGGENG